MRWLEISVTTDPETAEAVAELFSRYGHGGAVIETPLDCLEHELASFSPLCVNVKAYLPLDGTANQARQRLEEGLWHLGQISPLPAPLARELADEDWAEVWKQQYHRLHVGRRIVIVPLWEQYAAAAEEVAIRLEPGMAFGTGLHPTTRLCLEAMEAHLTSGSAVLDVGTGSGILAIAAVGLGAAHVLALDADPVAVSVAKQNVALNGVTDNVTVCQGTLPGGAEVQWQFTADGHLELVETGLFDLVLVNILAPVIVGMAPALAARCTPGGHLIVAGLIEDQEMTVAGALQRQRFEIVERAQEKDWVCLVGRRE